MFAHNKYTRNYHGHQLIDYPAYEWTMHKTVLHVHLQSVLYSTCTRFLSSLMNHELETTLQLHSCILLNRENILPQASVGHAT